MTKADRDRRLHEIAVELKRIRGIPIRDLALERSASPEEMTEDKMPTDRHDANARAPSVTNGDALHKLIMARNFLRDIK